MQLIFAKCKTRSCIFRLGKNLIVLADGCRRSDFKTRGECMNAREFYRSDYLDDIDWLGPFYCKINYDKFILLEDSNGFEEGDTIATIDREYYWIHSPLYDSDQDIEDCGFLKNLM